VISEVAVRGKDGEPLEVPELEAAAATALRACHPNAALTIQEVQERGLTGLVGHQQSEFTFLCLVIFSAYRFIVFGGDVVYHDMFNMIS